MGWASMQAGMGTSRSGSIMPEVFAVMHPSARRPHDASQWDEVWS